MSNHKAINSDSESRREQSQGEATGKPPEPSPRMAQTEGGEKPTGYVEISEGVWQQREPSSPPAPAGGAREFADEVYKELRQIYCLKGAEFCRPTLEKAWKAIAALKAKLEFKGYVGESENVLGCGHGKWNCKGDCITCLSFAIDEMIRRCSETMQGKTLAESALVKEREARERAEKALREATDAIRWALGSNGDFTERKAGQGPYWWRTELRERSERALASLKSSDGAK